MTPDELEQMVRNTQAAFPLNLISRRDYFAAAALTGILAAKKGGWDGPVDDAKKAYQYADAMLAAGKVGT